MWAGAAEGSWEAACASQEDGSAATVGVGDAVARAVDWAGPAGGAAQEAAAAAAFLVAAGTVAAGVWAD